MQDKIYILLARRVHIECFHQPEECFVTIYLALFSSECLLFAISLYSVQLTYSILYNHYEIISNPVQTSRLGLAAISILTELCTII